MGRRTELPVKTSSQDVMDELFSSIPVYENTTNGIQIRVQVFWIPNVIEQLDDDDDKAEEEEQEEENNAWIYRICIRNLNNDDVQVLERHWEATDSAGFKEEARNVDEETIIKAGDRYECACFTSLPTSSGFMKGYCALRFVGYSQCFTATIPPFSLDSPFEENQQIH